MEKTLADEIENYLVNSVTDDKTFIFDFIDVYYGLNEKVPMDKIANAIFHSNKFITINPILFAFKTDKIYAQLNTEGMFEYLDYKHAIKSIGKKFEENPEVNKLDKIVLNEFNKYINE